MFVVNKSRTSKSKSTSKSKWQIKHKLGPHGWTQLKFISYIITSTGNHLPKFQGNLTMIYWAILSTVGPIFYTQSAKPCVPILFLAIQLGQNFQSFWLWKIAKEVFQYRIVIFRIIAELIDILSSTFEDFCFLGTI